MAEQQETFEIKPRWDHRRTQRVLMEVPVLVQGSTKEEGAFEEHTRTLQVSAHGGLITLATRVKRGQKLVVTHVNTRESQECHVVFLGKKRGHKTEVGITFTHAAPTFWQIVFPPADWKRKVR